MPTVRMPAKGGPSFGGNFKKDILLIDTEFNGFDLKKHELLQLAAVLLDRKTLKEKKFFNSYVRPTKSKWKYRDPAAMAVNKITWETVKDAPPLKAVLADFDRSFGHNVIQAYYVGYSDKRLLMESYQNAGLAWKFDYHWLDVWSVAYAYLAARNRLESRKDFAGFGIEYMLKYFGMETPGMLHDALADCRVEAEILRRIMTRTTRGS
ncbi:MAG TPA: 3'-5' exonuclease [Patescibacteria group bacterium]|nr:3'-5' exonuclease [Patescibacteria group bacterium]